MKMLSDKNSLQHFGILGMKWGVRRDRNSGGIGNKKVQVSSEKRAANSEHIQREIDAYDKRHPGFKQEAKAKFNDKELEELWDRYGGDSIHSMLYFSQPYYKNSSPLSGEEKKIIKERKNDCLNAVIDATNKIDRATETKARKKLLNDLEEAGLNEDYQTYNKLAKQYCESETAARNKYIAENPKVLPKGMTIKYTKDGWAGDDLVATPDYTYNGKPVSFAWNPNPTRSTDGVFLEEPIEMKHCDLEGDHLMKMLSDENSLRHFGIPGMKWGVRRAEKKEAKRQESFKQLTDKTKDTFTSYRKYQKDMEARSFKAKGIPGYKRAVIVDAKAEQAVVQKIKDTDAFISKLTKKYGKISTNAIKDTKTGKEYYEVVMGDLKTTFDIED